MMDDKALDKIEELLDKLMIMLEAEGKTGIFAYYISRDDQELVDVNILSTKFYPEDALLALRHWTDALTANMAPGTELFDDEPPPAWKRS